MSFIAIASFAAPYAMGIWYVIFKTPNPVSRTTNRYLNLAINKNPDPMRVIGYIVFITQMLIIGQIIWAQPDIKMGSVVCD